ncbi:hypothetical protein [Micromonospora sp. DT229]|uniref:hypothetical protein n=1 Tax=Micromonospora sp. DT229 TaxID=3393430 RepID=UPI003CED1499
MDSGIGIAWDVVLAGTVVLFLFSVLRIPATPMIAISIGLVLCSSTYVERSTNTGFSEVVRVAGVLVLARFIWSAAGQDHSEDPALAARCGRFVRVLAATIVAYLAFATIGHGMYQELLLYSAGAVLTVVYGSLIARRISGPQIRAGILIALVLAISGSVVFGIVRAGDGILGERLRGLVSSPNLLGFYAVMVFALLLSYRTFRLWMLPVGAVTGAALVWTASRSSLIATVLLVTAHLALRRSRLRALWILLGATGLVLLLSNPAWMTDSDLAILRFNNSRHDSYAYTMTVLADSGWRGIGFGNELVQVASTPLRALVHAGLAGGLLVAAMYAVIVYYSAKVGRQTLLFGGVMVVHSLSEGWLLSPVGPMTMCFVAVWCALAKCETPPPSVPRHAARTPMPATTRERSYAVV